MKEKLNEAFKNGKMEGTLDAYSIIQRAMDEIEESMPDVNFDEELRNILRKVKEE